MRKLDTNGCFPEALAQILEEGLADYVAMDIKNTPEKYARTVGIPDFDMAPIRESIALLKGSGVGFEFRTTVVKELHTGEDIQAIGQWLHGSPRYFLQNFEDSGNLIGAGMHGFSEGEMAKIAEIARLFFGYVGVRGF